MKERDRTARRRNARNRPRESRPPGAIAFVLRFVVYWLGSLLLLGSAPPIEDWSVRGTVACLRAMLAWLTGSAVVNDATVTAAGVSFNVISDCTPLLPTSLFFSACLAFPATWRWKAVGLALGAALLWLYNLTRVLALFWVKARWPVAFEFVHVYLWQTATLIVVFLLFVLWLRAQPRDAGAPPAAAPALTPRTAAAGR
jgi:exosortase/archaeosortase family protein